MYLEDTYSTEAVDGNMLLFAVFDGHGGSKASEFCQNHLLNNIRRHINPAKERNPTGAMKVCADAARALCKRCVRLGTPNCVTDRAATSSLQVRTGSLADGDPEGCRATGRVGKDRPMIPTRMGKNFSVVGRGGIGLSITQ